ncbi:unnamed protein product [Cuscuta campestris]|uniref:Tudor domain-containing protein n=1 Tax=Cuscuta campestris TaxID=132261 RepID=A0A484NNX1_9ASTE|nr:unnamed protein product [Cuscuta campestris]
MQRHRKKESGGLAETSSKHDAWDISSQRSTEMDLSNSSTKDDNNRLLLCEECRMKAAEDDGIEENKRKSTKRKHYLGEEEVLKKQKIKYDESLVGSKIQVYWPLDDKYYDVVIEDFNHLNKTHEVLYIDGETEFLRLNEEEWRIISEKQKQKKKSGELAETSSEHGKMDISSQSNGFQSLGASPKRNGKFKDDTDVDPKSKEDPSKSASTDKYKDMTDNCPSCHFDDEGPGILKGMFCSSLMSKSSKPDASLKTAAGLQQDTITTKAMSKSNGNANGGTGK